MTTRMLTFADRWRLGFICACAALFVAIRPFTPLQVEWASLLPVYLGAGFLTLIGLTYRWLGRDETIAATVFIVAQIVVYSNVAVLDNYLGLELHRPLNDAFLARLDQALGIDWWGYVVRVKSVPYLGTALTLAYQSSLAQVGVAIMILGFTGRFDRLDRFSLGFMFTSALTILIWTAFPSMGPLVLHYAQGLPEPPFSLAVSRAEAMALIALHHGPTPTVSFGNMEGMIACPSFHTALAILTVYALWVVPYARTPAIVVNLFVLASIPADGGHHFVDIAAGAAITLVGLRLADIALRRKPAALDVASNRAGAMPQGLTT